MPELPEVEVTRLRLERSLAGHTFERAVIRVPKLRLPLTEGLEHILPGRMVREVGRRGKYLLFMCDEGCLIIHLGMTGFLGMVAGSTPPGKHDHLDFIFSGGLVLRFHDPRKFGSVIWTTGDPAEHQLLAAIGPEPLTPAFDGAYFFAASRSRSVAVKLLIMNSALVAGIGNIYANESLFRAGIHPARPACSLSRDECDRLAVAIKQVLTESIASGSSHHMVEGLIAYHPLAFQVYGRCGTPCVVCGALLEQQRFGNRSTVFCSRCQR